MAESPHNPSRLFAVAVASTTAAAVVLRAAYAWHLGVAPPWGSLVANAAAGAALGGAASRAATPLAGALASFLWAVLPAAIVASLFEPAISYASCAAAFALYFLGAGRAQVPETVELLTAGAFAGVAASFSSTALPLATFLVIYGAVSLARGRGGRNFAWLAGFAVVVAAAAALEYAAVGVPFAHLRDLLTRPVSPPPETQLLLQRLVAEAAAMLFWEGLGFGPAIVVGLAGAFYFLAARARLGAFYGGLLVVTLALYNFFPTSLRGGYAPIPLEATLWLPAALPAVVLGGAAVASVWREEEGSALGRWAAAFGGAAILATLFINGHRYLAPVSLAILLGAALTTLACAGAARRFASPRPQRWTRRLAATAAILTFILPVLILYS